MGAEVAWFPIDAKFPTTQAARIVSRRFGEAGFSAYVRLLCALVGEEGGRLRLQTEDEWADLAELAHMGDVGECRELVAILQRYGAVVVEEGHIAAPIVSTALYLRDEAREKKVIAGKASGEARRKKKAEREAQKNTDEHRYEHSSEQCSQHEYEQKTN